MAGAVVASKAAEPAAAAAKDTTRSSSSSSSSSSQQSSSRAANPGAVDGHALDRAVSRQSRQSRSHSSSSPSRRRPPSLATANMSATQLPQRDPALEARLVRKIDLRLCTIAGILASLDLLDSNIISSASVTSMFQDLDLGVGNRYSVSIFIFTLSSIAFQLPATIAVRYIGPRIFFAASTVAFGLITLGTAFVQTWHQMIVVRVLLGVAMSGIYPGLSFLISTWYTRREQQLRFAFLQTGEVFILATGSIVNYGLQQLDGRGGLAGWRWMFLVQGLVATLVGLATYFWIPMLPDSGASKSFRFLDVAENELAVARINADRADATDTPFTWKAVLRHSADLKVYVFGVMFFLLNLVSTALAYFLPMILQNGLGLSTGASIVLSSPPYYWSIIPVLVTSYIADRSTMRGPTIVFNSLVLITGFSMLGFATSPAARYVGCCLATGAYVSNWAALTAYYANNVAGQWKRVWTAAIVTVFNGAGGIAGSFIFNQSEAPRYPTAIWTVLSSHIGMIALVLAFSVWFYLANGRVKRGKLILEERQGFLHTY